MEINKSFYANGYTVTINDAEAVITFVRNIPNSQTVVNPSEILGDVSNEEVMMEEAMTVIMPRNMLNSFPEHLKMLFEKEAESNTKV